MGRRAGVGPVLGLRRKWSPSLSVCSIQLGVQLQPRTVVKGKDEGWRWEVDSGFRFLTSGLVWGPDGRRARKGVRPGQGSISA